MPPRLPQPGDKPKANLKAYGVWLSDEGKYYGIKGGNLLWLDDHPAVELGAKLEDDGYPCEVKTMTFEGFQVQ